MDFQLGAFLRTTLPLGITALQSHDSDRHLMARVTPELLLAVVPRGSPRKVAEFYKQYVDAGAMVPKIMDSASMTGTRFAARSAEKVRAAEDELLRMVAGE